MSFLKTVRRDGGSQQMKSSEKSRKAVIGYVIALALVVIALILLSYLIHQRDSTLLDSLNAESASAKESVLTLQTENHRLLEENTALKAELDAESMENDTLSASVDKLNEQLKTEKEQYDAENSRLRAENEALREKLGASEDN